MGWSKDSHDDLALFAWNLAKYGAALWVCRWVYTVIYNIFFHPLAHIPGPMLRKISYAPRYSELWTGEFAYHWKKLHEEYGDVIRVGPDMVSFINPDAWKDIHSQTTTKKALPKDPELYNPTADSVPEILSANDVDHTRIRRLLNHAFSESALRGQEPILRSYFDLLIRRLRDQIRGPEKGKVDMVQWYNFTTFDVIGDLSFGESFKALEQGKYHPWIESIFKYLKFTQRLRVLKAYPLIGYPIIRLLNLFPQTAQAKKRHMDFTRQRTEQRLAKDTTRRDFVSYIQRAKDEQGMSTEELTVNLSTIIIAGSETSATLLSAATYFLLKNPSVLQKLYEEVRSKFSSTEEMTFVSVGQLPYLHACLQEALRMHPPVPGMLVRRTRPGGAVIAGYKIPGNAIVGISHLAANFSAKHFADADQFVPERWLGSDERYANDNRAVVQPFSMGPRNCIGKNLAWAEMGAIFARILWNFDMELCAESSEWSRQKVFVLWHKPPLNIRLTERKFS